MNQRKLQHMLKTASHPKHREVSETRDGADRLPAGYLLRKGQKEFIDEASTTIRDHRIFLGNAPCGIGKSLAAILAVLPHFEESKLLITFRTRSQLHIYLKEFKALNSGFPVVSLYSKQLMCPVKIRHGLSYYDFFEGCRRLKENCESLTRPYCRFFLKNLGKKRETEELALECAHKFMAPLEATKLFWKRGFCAYEALRSILHKARVFLGTYHYIFNPSIRGFLLKDFAVNLDKAFLIADEAHNIPAFARELLSDRLADTTLDRAQRETERFPNDTVSSIRDYLALLDEQVFRRAKKALKKSELRGLQPETVEDLCLEHYGVSGLEVAEAFSDYGEYVKQKRQELGQERLLSYNHRIGTFLKAFFEKLDETYIHLIRKDRENDVVLEVRSFDGREITAPILAHTRGSILMSGSLSPPQIYRDLMVHDPSNVVVREYSSPFPAENRLILGAEDVSSRFELRNNEMLRKWQQYIEVISNTNCGNVAFFFTSYDLMRKTLNVATTGRNIVVEERGTKRSNILKALKQSSNTALFGVMGGKLSEGIDYPDNLLTCVVAMGLPYATWDVYQKGLIHYYDKQFSGDGETYAYLTPAILRLIQTIGRVHRSSQDKGCIVMLDERITKPKVQQKLPTYIQQEMKIVENVGACRRKIEQFWQTHSGN